MSSPDTPTAALAVPATALAIAAHPDDVEFNCGATLARWAEHGCVVSYLICTDGSKGTWNADADPAELAVLRESEQRTAAKVLGVRGEVVFLGETDGELANVPQHRNAVAKHIRRLRPEVVLAHDPWKRYRIHPDHREAGFLATESVVAARDPHFFPEHLAASGLAHHRPKALLLFEADVENHVEEAEERYVSRRIAALEAHVSQFESTHYAGLDESDPSAAFRAGQIEQLRECGERHGLAYAEGFHLISGL